MSRLICEGLCWLALGALVALAVQVWGQLLF